MSKLSKQGRVQPCVKVFREISIDYKGNVFLCCNIFPDDPKNKALGNLNQDSLFEIFSSKKNVFFRKHLFDFSPKNPPCSTCNEESFSNQDSNIRHKILQEVRSI